MNIKSLNISIFSDYINPYWGGYSRNIYILAEMLQKKGINTSVFCINCQESYVQSSFKRGFIPTPLLRNSQKRPGFHC